MIKKVALVLAVLLLVTGVGLFFWVRSALGTDAVRTGLAAQLSRSLGQPVTVEGVSATFYPRVTVTLTGVSIGSASEITMHSLDVGSDFRALLSGRVERAALHLDGAHLTLPLPHFAFSSTEPTSTDSGSSQSPVTVESVDEVTLTDVQIVSRGRILRGDIEVVPHGTSALTIRRISLVADGARIEGTGEITDLAGPVGRIDLKAGALDLDQLMAVASDFSDRVPGTGTAQASGAAGPPGPRDTSKTDVTVTFAADRATMGGISIDSVEGRARLAGDAVSVDPMKFNLFGGTYDGSLGATLGSERIFRWKASLKNVDVAAVTAYVNNPGVMTGRLNADVDLTGSGIDATSAMKTARGTARVIVTNGVVKNLALVKAAVVATSLDPQAAMASAEGPHDEPFTEMGGTLVIAGGTASTQDLHLISADIRLDAAGALKLDNSAARLNGQVQMSEALSKQANPTFARFTQQDGRITLPVTVIGTAGRYSVQVDTASMTRRALTNEAESQARQAAKKLGIDWK